MSELHQGLPAHGLEHAPYAGGVPTAQADFKTCAGDFVVEEVLGFEPSGDGEHLFLLLQTDDHNTRYTVKCLARLFGVSQRQVSYSGLKDRRGLTSQWFSIHLPGKDPQPDQQQLAAQGIRLLRFGRHHRKLRIGTHKSNRFFIRLRNVQNPGDLQSRAAAVAASGVPNYFGPQRFGHHGANIDEALAYAGEGKLPEDRAQRSRVLTTLRSWLFNGELGQRVRAGSWQAWQPGDPIMLDGSQSYFHEAAWSTTLQARYNGGDIHLGGYLAGAESAGVPPSILALFKLANMKVDVRALRLLPHNLVLGSDTLGETLEFELPKGAFATTVLRELVKLKDLSILQAK